jgi:hypothetical protein
VLADQKKIQSLQFQDQLNKLLLHSHQQLPLLHQLLLVRKWSVVNTHLLINYLISPHSSLLNLNQL